MTNRQPKRKGVKKKGKRPRSDMRPLPESDDLLWEYEKYLVDYMERVVAPVFMANLNKVFPGYNWQQDGSGTWFSTEVPEADESYEPHYVTAHYGGVVYEEVDGELEASEETEEVEVYLARVVAKPFYLITEWEDEWGAYDHPIEIADSLLPSRRRRRRVGGASPGRRANPGYIRACWRIMDRLGLAIPDPDECVKREKPIDGEGKQACK